MRRPVEYYQVRIAEDNKVLWRGMTLIHVKDLQPERRDDVLNEIRRLKEQGFGRNRIQKELAEKYSVYVPEAVIRRAIAGGEIDWTRSGVRGPKKDLGLRKAIFKRVKELRSEGRSYQEIQAIIRQEFGVKLSNSHISYWCRDVVRPDGSVKEITLTPDYWWLIGLLVADGNVNIKHWDNYRVFRLELAAKERILIEKAAKVAGQCSITMNRWDETLYLEIQLRGLFDLFQRVRQLIEERKFDELLEMMGEDGAKAFVKGFFDGDGSGLFVNLANNDLNILEYIRYALKCVCCIRTSEPVLCRMKGTMSYLAAENRWITTRKDVYIVFVYPEDYHRFFELVGTTIDRKVRLWKLSEKILHRRSTRFGRPYLEEIRRRHENGEDWAEVLELLRRSIGAKVRKKRRKTPTPISPLFNIHIVASMGSYITVCRKNLY